MKTRVYNENFRLKAYLLSSFCMLDVRESKTRFLIINIYIFILESDLKDQSRPFQ